MAEILKKVSVERFPVVISKHEAQGHQSEEHGEHSENDSERAP